MSNFKLKENMDVVETGISTSGKNVLPISGFIMPFAGSTAPTGWVICDGTNGTPDLRGHFVIGAGSGQTPSNTAAAIGSTNHGHNITWTVSNVNTATGTHAADGHSTASNTDSANHSHTVYGAMTTAAPGNQTNYVNNPNGSAISTTPRTHTHNTNQWTVGTNVDAGFTHYHNIGWASSQVETAHGHTSNTPSTTLSDSAMLPAYALINYIMKV